MAQARPNYWFTPDAAWKLREWSIDHLAEALISFDGRSSWAAAMEVLSRNDVRGAVPLARWALNRKADEGWLVGPVARWLLTLPEGRPRAEALGIIAKLPDVELQKVLLRGYQRK